MGWKLDTGDRFKSLYGVKPPDIKGEQEQWKNGNPRKYQYSNLLEKIHDERTDGRQGYEFMPVTIGGIRLWNPIIRITGRKTVIETPLVEQRGSVKEIIGIDDYVINIRGVIKRTDGRYPDDELTSLLELYRRNEAVEIQSAITANLLNGNEYVVITNLNLPDKPGFVESIEYAIECVSDTQFVLEIED